MKARLNGRAREAVGRAFAEVLANRYPGVSWTVHRPGEGAQRLGTASSAGEVVGTLASQQDECSVLDGQAAPVADHDHVDGRGQ